MASFPGKFKVGDRVTLSFLGTAIFPHYLGRHGKGGQGTITETKDDLSGVGA